MLSTSKTVCLRIGWSTINITPDAPVQLGGQFAERISTHVNDPCMANVLVLEGVDGEDRVTEQAVLISCDLVSVSEEYMGSLRAAVGHALPALDVSKISISCTHTHTSPVTREGIYPEVDRDHVMLPLAYATFWCERVTQAVVEAWERRSPGGISHALGHAVLGWPRRAIYADGSAIMYGDTCRDDFRAVEGPSDPGVEILFTWDAHDKLTGIVAAAACPAQVLENKMFVSADYWYATSERLRAHFGESLHVLGLISSAGDQSPRDRVRRKRGEPSMNDIEGMNELGRRLAHAIIDAFENAQSARETAPIFKHRSEQIDLPRQMISDVEFQQAQAVLDQLLLKEPLTPGSHDAGVRRRQRAVVDRYNKQQMQKTRPTEVHTLRIGDVAMVTCPFELFLDYGMQIRGRSHAHQTFVVQLANGKGQYLPTQRAIDHGGYSGTIHSIQVGPEGGLMLVNHLVKQINAMFNDTAP